jgi:hypothetical protein
MISGFRSAIRRQEVEGLFKDFLRTHPDFHFIGIYNQGGIQLLTVEGSAQLHTTDFVQSRDADPLRPDVPNLNLKKNDTLWLSPITVRRTLDEDRTLTIPIIGVSIFLPGSNFARRIGYMTLGLDLDVIMRILPAGVQIQDGKGNRVVRNDDGYVELNEHQTDFTGDSGWLTVSPNETIHYIKCPFLLVFCHIYNVVEMPSFRA